jgi:hypothetical protein
MGGRAAATGRDQNSAVIVTILGVFLTRILAIARGMKGWRYI